VRPAEKVNYYVTASLPRALQRGLAPAFYLASTTYSRWQGRHAVAKPAATTPPSLIACRGV
jgi:hypothetical protein